MSAGSFVTAVYSATYGGGTERHPIRVQPETLLAARGAVVNAESPNPATNPISAQVSKSKRSLGLHARTVSLRLGVDETPPEGGYTATSTTRIPALQEAFYNACAVKGTTVTYLGATWVTTGVSAEKVT